MPGPILDREQEELLASERDLLARLRGALERHEASPEDRRALADSARQLDELFLLVVVGEFNAGKSTFVNALLGEDLLPEGVTPTTTRIHRIRHGAEPARERRADGVEELRAPAPLLESLEIVDTPGTNALAREHEALTEEFIPRSDLVLFITSADRPFTESERAFMERIRRWGKKLVLVVNKIDFLAGDAELDEVLGFMRSGAERLLGLVPPIFPVAARLALAAKREAGDAPPTGEAWRASRFAALESWLVETLDEGERLRLKLGNPLGVGRRLATTYREAVEERIGLLAADVSALSEIDRQLDLYREDMGREFRFRLRDVEAVLHEFEARGQRYLDETMRLPRILDLLNRSRLAAEFERKVIADAPQRIEKRVDEVIDWMVAAELRQWKGVTNRLEARRAEHAERLIGEVGSFDYDRERLLDTVKRAAARTIDAYDREAESERMAASVQQAVAETAVVEVSALGLGALVGVLATTQLADVTGLLAAGTLATLGLFVLPARKRKAKAELGARIDELRRQLLGAMTEQFDREIEASVHRIGEAIAPYSRFVRAERERLDEARDELAGIEGELAELAARIEEL